MSWYAFCLYAPRRRLPHADLFTFQQAEMTPDAHAIVPEGSEFEKRLLEAKYKIYKESISIQLKWRDEIDAIQK